MPRLLLALPLLLGTAVMATPADEPPKKSADDELAKRFRDWLDEEFKRHPVFATQQGNHEYDDRMDNLSPGARRTDYVRLERDTVLLDAIEAAKLSNNSQIDLDIWKHSLEYALWQ